jgi:hypothetical protein
MKEISGSTLIMLVMHAYPEPPFSEAGDKETSGVGLLHYFWIIFEYVSHASSNYVQNF